MTMTERSFTRSGRAFRPDPIVAEAEATIGANEEPVVASPDRPTAPPPPPPPENSDTNTSTSNPTERANSGASHPAPNLLAGGLRIIIIHDRDFPDFSSNLHLMGFRCSPRRLRARYLTDNNQAQQFEFEADTILRDSTNTSTNQGPRPAGVTFPSQQDLHHDTVVAQEDAPACIICYQNKPICTAIPCLHQSFCLACSREICLNHLDGIHRVGDLPPCPKCRTPVERFQRNIMESGAD